MVAEPHICTKWCPIPLLRSLHPGTMYEWVRSCISCHNWLQNMFNFYSWCCSTIIILHLYVTWMSTEFVLNKHFMDWRWSRRILVCDRIVDSWSMALGFVSIHLIKCTTYCKSASLICTYKTQTVYVHVAIISSFLTVQTSYYLGDVVMSYKVIFSSSLYTMMTLVAVGGE